MLEPNTPGTTPAGNTMDDGVITSPIFDVQSGSMRGSGMELGGRMAKKFGNLPGISTAGDLLPKTVPDSNEAVAKMIDAFDVNGDGAFCREEVETMARFMISEQRKVQQMKKWFFLLVLVFLGVCGLLVGLMVAANEASKEEHVVDGVKVDLDDNAVQVAILESFTILKMFPTLNAGALNKLTYLSFTGYADSDPGNINEFRFHVSDWMRSSQTSTTTLISPTGSTVMISGTEACRESSSPAAECLAYHLHDAPYGTPSTYYITSGTTTRRLLGNNGKHCQNKLFASVNKMQECFFGADAMRRLGEEDSSGDSLGYGIFASKPDPSFSGSGAGSGSYPEWSFYSDCASELDYNLNFCGPNVPAPIADPVAEVNFDLEMDADITPTDFEPLKFAIAASIPDVHPNQIEITVKSDAAYTPVPTAAPTDLSVVVPPPTRRLATSDEATRMRRLATGIVLVLRVTIRTATLAGAAAVKSFVSSPSYTATLESQMHLHTSITASVWRYFAN